MSKELAYILLILGLFLVPKILMRFAIPSAITALVLGAVIGPGFGWFHHDDTVKVLATLGIVTLFLFAGLEVDKDDLRRDARILGQHLVIVAITLAVGTVAAVFLLDLAARPAALVALALFTPSTGFILDSIKGLDVDDEQKRWIKSKAIAGELLALGALFVVLQTTSVVRALAASAALVAIIVALPVIFRVFARVVAPYAPRSEFTFLVIIAIISAYATKQLGVYYLVGAFVVGVAAQRFREELPAMASERMLQAVEVFAGFFVPFYFFSAGTHIDPAALGWKSIGLGLLLLLVVIPIRIGAVAIHRGVALREGPKQALRTGVALVPTLVFTLVLAEILRDRFGAPPWLFGALMVYTVVNTLLPGITLKLPPPSYDAPQARKLEPEEQDRAHGHH